MTASTLEYAPVFAGSATDISARESGRHRLRFTAQHYEQITLLGAFDGLRVELIDGKLIASRFAGRARLLDYQLERERVRSAARPSNGRVRDLDSITR